MKIVIAALLLAGITLVAAQSAEARQYVGSGGQVVHTRRAPVVLHRALPPFRGQHVYQPGR